MKSALISVSNKSGICEFAAVLAELGYDILSTGGTAKILRDANIAVTDVAAYTEFPEMMDGRVKTLHPMIHGGILGRRGQDDEIMSEHGMRNIDIVVVNLYPFQQTIADPNCSLETAIENIDIGGPSMVRAAAKNHTSVAIVVDPEDYLELADTMKSSGGKLDNDQRFKLAMKAFAHTAQYDGAIASYLSKCLSPALASDKTQNLPDQVTLELNKDEDLRYGENPHQRAGFYRDENPPSASIGNARQIHGKPLSYNNIADTDAAIDCVMAFENPACCIVKHANPCGVTESTAIASAYEGAYLTDPTSAFGGIIAFNRELDADTAERIVSRQFVEVIAAPAISTAAKEICEQKKDLRLLEIGPLDTNSAASNNNLFDFKRVTGGFLIQDRDQTKNNFLPSDLQVVSKKQPTAEELSDLMFAWVVVKCVKSNAIVYAKNRSTIGVGAGQMSRVYSARVAAMKAADEGLTVAGSVMASDAFFPFRDGIDAAAEVGISAVIQPGGSKRDEEVIAAANEHNMVMVFTGMRHFRH